MKPRPSLELPPDSNLFTSAAHPLLLVSVRNAHEAQLALQGNADIIDIKEPANGPLGQAAPATCQAIADVVAGRAPLSIALGELIDHPHPWPACGGMALPVSTRFIKIGLAGLAGDDQTWSERLLACRRAYPQAQLVAVAYWDAPNVQAPPVDRVLDWAIAHRTAAFLIDTADKRQPGLLASPEDEPRLREIMTKARAHELPVALAGRLTDQRFDAAAALGPAVVGVRSAACHEQDRQRGIDPQRISALKARLARHARPTKSLMSQA